MNATYKGINRIIEAALVIIFGLMVIDVIWQVVSRYFIGQSSSFTEEFARFALIWLAVLGAAYLNGQRAHLAMDYLLKKLEGEALKRRMRIIEMLMMAFAIIVMVIGGGNLVYTTFILGQQSPAMGISLGVIYSIVPISGLLIVFYSLYNISKISEYVD